MDRDQERALFGSLLLGLVFVVCMFLADVVSTLESIARDVDEIRWRTARSFHEP
jgi:hypothetical protein